ncbi:DUF4235 domain-containing protein [Actinokineospora sp. 24-640]
MLKLIYRPLSLLISVLGGVLSGALFKRLWHLVSDQEDAPKATSPEHTTREVLVAAMIQGAIFGVVKAAVDRAGAKGYRKITGESLDD